jgi:acetyl/propionyl-CoA carboxylase alpha subunit
MLAKLIARAATREEAIATLRNACANFEVAPVQTNLGFLTRCLSNPDFITGRVDTGFIPSRIDGLAHKPPPDDRIAQAAASVFAGYVRRPPIPRVPNSPEQAVSPWRRLTGFRLNSANDPLVRMTYDGKPLAAVAGAKGGDATSINGVAFVFRDGDAYEFHLDTGEAEGGELAAGDGAILSPMPGKIVSVAAKAGAKLKKGDPILVLEAMKMEHTLTAPFDGKLAELNAKAGAQVSEGVLLAKMEATD